MAASVDPCTMGYRFGTTRTCQPGRSGVTPSATRHLRWRLVLVTGAEGAIGDGRVGRRGRGPHAGLMRPGGASGGQDHPSPRERIPAQLSHDRLLDGSAVPGRRSSGSCSADPPLHLHEDRPGMTAIPSWPRPDGGSWRQPRAPACTPRRDPDGTPGSASSADLAGPPRIDHRTGANGAVRGRRRAHAEAPVGSHGAQRQLDGNRRRRGRAAPDAPGQRLRGRHRRPLGRHRRQPGLLRHHQAHPQPPLRHTR